VLILKDKKMKTILTKILTVGSVALLALASCKNNDAKVTTSGAKIGSLNITNTTLSLDRNRTADTTSVIAFNFTPAQYNYNAVVSNNLQIDSVGDNWKNPQVIAMPANTFSKSFKTVDINNLLLKIVPGNTTSKVNVRIQYQLSAYVSSYSNVITMTVTPFIATSWLWVPGDYEGWNNAGGSLDSLVSPNGDGKYYGIINIPSGTGEFKIIPVKGSWNVAYGDGGNNTLSTSGGNLKATPGSQYYITVDMNAKKYTLAAADYYSVTGNEVVGGDWGVDQFMKFVNDGTNKWVATLNLAPVSGGGFKIRQDAQWTNSWGIPQSTSAGAGQANVLASDHDDNLTVSAAGNYKITFTVAPSVYGSAPTVVAPYSLTKQ
jgi:starch-binding outer membrane protein SusE/F